MLRFLLDLQEANQTVVGLGPDDSSRSSRNPYDTSSIISSLGGFVNPDLSARLADDDSEVHGTDTGEPSEARPAPSSLPFPYAVSLTPPYRVRPFITFRCWVALFMSEGHMTGVTDVERWTFSRPPRGRASDKKDMIAKYKDLVSVGGWP